MLREQFYRNLIIIKAKSPLELSSQGRALTVEVREHYALGCFAP